ELVLSKQLHLNKADLVDFGMMYFSIPNIFTVTSEDYKCIKFNKHTIFFTDDLNYQIIEINNYRVLVLGTLFDVKKPNSSVEEIITELLNYEFESDNYFNEMSFYNGRFIIFVEENNNLHLYP